MEQRGGGQLTPVSEGWCGAGELGGVTVGRIFVSPLANVGLLGFFCRLTEPVRLEGKARRAGTLPISWPHN